MSLDKLSSTSSHLGSPNKATTPKDPELEQLKDVFGESINVSQQRQLMEAYVKEKREQDRAKVRVNPPIQSQQLPSNVQSIKAGGHRVQKHIENYRQPQGSAHVYDTISDGNSRACPAEHGKAGTVGRFQGIQGTGYTYGELYNPPPRSKYSDKHQGQQDGYNYKQNNDYYHHQYDNVQHSQPVQAPVRREQLPPSNSHRTIPVAHTDNATIQKLVVGSTVQLATADPNTPQRYGVIRWMGSTAPSQVHGEIAGIELVRQYPV